MSLESVAVGQGVWRWKGVERTEEKSDKTTKTSQVSSRIQRSAVSLLWIWNSRQMSNKDQELAAAAVVCEQQSANETRGEGSQGQRKRERRLTEM